MTCSVKQKPHFQINILNGYFKALLKSNFFAKAKIIPLLKMLKTIIAIIMGIFIKQTDYVSIKSW